MSEWRVEVIRVGAVDPHPNADRLEITKVHGGYPCVVRKDQFHEGDLAVYVPIDSVVDVTRPELAFLADKAKDGKYRIRAQKIRGVFSMGLLLDAPQGASEGDPCAERLWIAKWEPPEDPSGESERCPHWTPKYDLEALRRWPDVLVPGEPVVILEKIHGASARLLHDGERLWVGSHTAWKAPNDANPWWAAVKHHGGLEGLACFPGVCVYAELYGKVQDLRYGIESGGRLVVFDCWSDGAGWRSWSDIVSVADTIGLPMVPVLYEGAWAPDLKLYAEGPTVLGNGAHVREGMVVRPLVHREDPRCGRVVLKLHGESFLVRRRA